MKTVDEIFGMHFNGLHYDDITKEGIIKFAEDYAKYTISQTKPLAIPKITEDKSYIDLIYEIMDANNDKRIERMEVFEPALDETKLCYFFWIKKDRRMK